MGAVGMVARARRRGSWPALLAMSVLVAIAGGAVTAAVAGARRTDSSLARFEDRARSATFEIDAGHPAPEALRAFTRSPGVEAVGLLRQIALYNPDAGFLPVAGPVDQTFGHAVDRARLVRGRRARRATDVNIGEGLARRLGVDVGDRLSFGSFTQEQIDSGELERGAFEPRGPEVDFHVVGIVRRPLDLGVRGEAGGVIVPTRAFVEQYGDRIGSFTGLILRVRTADGEVDAARVGAAARRAFGAQPEFRIQPLGIEGRSARSAIGVGAAALWILAAVAAIVGVIAMAFAVARHAWTDVDDQDVLRAIGLRRRQRWAATVAFAVPVAILGGAGAVVLAAVASPAFPIGVARAAEPDPGLRVDGWVLAGGFVATVAVVLAAAALPAWAVTRAHAPLPRRSALAARLAAHTALSPSAVTGIGFALERGRGRRAVPVWSSVAVMTLGVLGVVGATVFGSSLAHLADDPAAYGWTWDASAYGVDHLDDPCPAESSLTHASGVGDVVTLCYRDIEVAGSTAYLWAFRPVRGVIAPTIVAGRAPTGRDEIALGRDLLDAAGAAVGDRVRIATDGGVLSYRVVGQVVMPSLDDPLPLAGSAVATPGGLARAGGAFDSYTAFRFRAGADRDRVLAAIDEPLGGSGARLTTVPAEIERLRQVDGLPVVLAALTAFLGLAAVAFTLVVSVHRRARDLAVLKTIGFVRRQVRATVAWQASTLGAMGVTIGGLLGLVAGRAVWHPVAGGLGVATQPSWPVPLLALLLVLGLVAVNAVAAVPAQRAACTPPAVVLRSE